MNFPNNIRNRAKRVSVLLALLLTTAPSLLSAQFLNIQIEVEPEVEATVERSLNFGSILTNSGMINFPLGDPDIGVFGIRAVQTQRMLIEMDVPDYLEHSELDARIPVGLELAVNRFGVNDPGSAVRITDENREVTVSTPPDQPAQEWSYAYLYVYGWIDVGTVPPGIYTGDVVLNIEYD